MVNDFKREIDDIHNHGSLLFGYKIVSPDSEDPYTEKDIEVMMQELGDKRIEDKNGSIRAAAYPLQNMINIVQYMGGECFWHECDSSEDMSVYFSREMLENMRDCGFEYVARIRVSGEVEETNKMLDDFLRREAERYARGIIDTENALIDYAEFKKGEKDVPHVGNSIFFSTIPIVSEKYEQLLTPISGAIIKMKHMESDREAREREYQKKHDEMIASMEHYFRSEGLSKQEIDSILHPKKSR